MSQSETHPRNASPAQPQAWIDGNGSIQVQALTISPSELWSPEFAAFFLKAVVPVGDLEGFQVPARTASPEQWAEFDRAWDRRFNAEPLARACGHYAVDIEETTIAGVRAAIVTPRGGVPREHRTRMLINLHGGGFVFHRGLSFGLLESIPVAALGQVTVVTIDYRQAPFHSYPAATQDALAVYLEQLSRYAPEAIGIYGCSAGGTLATQVLATCQARDIPQPGAVGVFNIAPMPFGRRPPWGRGWGESGMWYSGVPKNEMSPADQAVWEPVLWYMEAADPKDPQAYPGSSDAVLSRFPPTLFLSGTRDFALSSIVFTHARLLRLGVCAELYVLEGGGHAGHVAPVGTPEAHNACAYVARWFAKHLR